MLLLPIGAAQAPRKLSRSQGSLMKDQTLPFHSVPISKSIIIEVTLPNLVSYCSDVRSDIIGLLFLASAFLDL